MSFDDAVKKARGTIPVEDKQFPRWKGVRCVPATGRQEDNADEWPIRFFIGPRIGDEVMSGAGRILTIISIIHRVGGTEIKLGHTKPSETTGTN